MISLILRASLPGSSFQLNGLEYGTLNTVPSIKRILRLFTLAETHRNLHRLLAGAGQPCTEFDKTHTALYQCHPLVANRTFVDLVATVLLHAPTIISSTSSLGDSNALATTTVATALAAAPTDESALEQQIDSKASEGPRRDS